MQRCAFISGGKNPTCIHCAAHTRSQTVRSVLSVPQKVAWRVMFDLFNPAQGIGPGSSPPGANGLLLPLPALVSPGTYKRN